MEGQPVGSHSDQAGDDACVTIAIEVASVPNFRDVAGAHGYETPHGSMRRGFLFRSSAFDPSPHDQASLAAYRIALVHDLRGQDEIDRRPDVVPAGATWKHAWIPGLDMDAARAMRTSADVRQAMLDHYRGFVSVPRKREVVGAVLAGLSGEDRPQVFHCSEGKDRTGWIAMIVQALVGVSEADILRDYLLTNERTNRALSTLDAARKAWGNRPDEFFRPAMIADADYLEAGIGQIEADYGDVESYVIDGLGLTSAQLGRLRGVLVEPGT